MYYNATTHQHSFLPHRRIPSYGWIRVGGTLSTLFGFYYLGAALDECEKRPMPRRFYQATIVGRLFLSAVFGLLVAIGQVPRELLVLAVVNLWSAWAMHRTMDMRRGG